MEDRQLKIILALALIVSGMAAAYFLIDEGEEEDPWLDEDATQTVWDVEAEGVTRLELVGPEDNHLVAEKQGDEWALVQPIPYPADQHKIDYLVDDLVRVKLGIPIPDAVPSEFGLGDPPRALATLTWEDGTKASLALGDQAIGDRLYALAEDGSVVATGGSISFSLGRDAEYYRDNKVFDFSRSQVSQVRLSSDGGVLDLHREGHQWWLEGWTRADDDAVNELLMSLLDMRVDEWYDQLEGPMEDPAVEVFVAEEDGETWTARVSRRTPNGVLVQLPTGAAAFTPMEPLAFLGQGPRDVGDPHAFPVDRITLTGVDVELGDASWSLELQDGNWTHDGMPTEGATAALDALSEVSIAYRAEAPPAPSESWGLVTLRSGDLAPREVVCGQQIEQHRVCQDRDGGSPYLVPAEELEALAGLF